MRIKSLIKISIVMLFAMDVFPQSSFGLTGIRDFSDEPVSSFNSIESNPSAYSLLKDWGLTLSYGGEFSEDVNTNIYLLSLAKSFSNHFLMIRYTPGYQKEFLFSTGEIIFEDSSSQTLNSSFNYKELFGAGYSYKFSGNVSAGLSLRYFTQEFETEIFYPVFSDTNYLKTDRQIETGNFWKADIGFNYSPSNKIMLSASSINLFNFGESEISSDYRSLLLKKNKAAQLGISYIPFNGADISFIYETNNSFQAAINAYLRFENFNLGAGVTAFHDEYQDPFIAGFIPSLYYSNSFIGVTVSGIKYFSERNASGTFSEFSENGLTNILNNRYSFDKLILTLSFTLNTVKVQSVKFYDVEIVKEIYPTLTELYIDLPYAVGKVINLLDEPVTIKPYSRIEGINDENIYSPEVHISANDTAEVKFFTLIPEKVNKNKNEISYADFYVSVSGDQPDDNMQKPVLINSSNSWDGNVFNLKYFIKKGNNFSFNYTREILSGFKNELDTLPGNLTSFFKTKIIFNEMVKDLVYISDPRASAEYVQFPEETVKIKGGDCDDLSVLLSSLLESIGIETAFVDYKNDELRHVNLLVNTGLRPEDAKLITENDSKYFLRKNEKGEDEIWIPVETTSLNNFYEAWNAGSEKFNREALQKLGLATGKVEIIDI